MDSVQRDKHAYLGYETEARADRCTQNYQRNPPQGLWLQADHLSASQARLNTSKSRQLKLYLGSSAVCKTSHIKTVCLSREEGTAASQNQNHPSTAACLSPQSSFHWGSAECSSLHLSRAPFLLHCRGRACSLLKLSTGMPGLPPPEVPPLASKPFKPVFMSLSVLHGRPRCQAPFTQLPSSQDTMLSSVYRQRHFHGKGSALNPLLMLSEPPCQADTVC